MKCFLVSIACIFVTHSVYAQVESDTVTTSTDPQGARAFSVTRGSQTALGIQIDGDITEAAWLNAEPIGDMRVTEPDTLDATPHKTRSRFLYTERGIYIAIEMDQPLDSLVQRISSRDNTQLNRDSVMITLDTSGDGLFGYWMMLALGDNQADGTVLPERQYNSEWDGAWLGATQITDTGWSAEFFVPWGQMAMPNEDGVRNIGVSVIRSVAYLDQKWSWPAIPETASIFMSNLPVLQFQGVDLHQQWSIFPYVSATQDNITSTTDLKTGVDLFWRPSSNFQFTGTLNPDFGSVESDNVVVNLSANETFFPEKRLFFQEGQEIFNTTPRSTGSNGQRLSIVNTRRIGGRPRRPELPVGTSLSARDRLQNADLLGALKATGQAGSFRYGLLSAQEEETAYEISNSLFTQEGRDFTAFRVIYEDNKGAAYRGLGYIGTLVEHSESSAEVHAVDFHYLTTKGRWNIDGQIITSDSNDHGRGQGGFADIVYTPRQGIKHNMQITIFDDKLDVNDFGYQARNNNMEAWYRFEWTKSDLNFVRNIRINPFLRYEENSEGERTNNMLPLLNMSATLNNLDRVSFQFQHFPKRYDDRNSFGNGTFATRERTSYSLSYSTNPSLPVSIDLGYSSTGELVSGRTIGTNVGLSWRPEENIHLSASISHDNRDGWLLHQRGQYFTGFEAEQWNGELSFNYFATAKQQLTMTLQWVGIDADEDKFFYLPSEALTRNKDLVSIDKPNGTSDSFGLSQLNFQLRYRWQIAPLSDLYVVYTKGDSRRAQVDDFDELFQQSWQDPLSDQLVVKLRYRFGT